MFRQVLQFTGLYFLSRAVAQKWHSCCKTNKIPLQLSVLCGFMFMLIVVPQLAPPMLTVAPSAPQYGLLRPATK